MPGCDDSYALWKPYLDNWQIKLNKEKFFNFWFQREREIPELIELVMKLRKEGIKIIALSNNFKERTNYYLNNFPAIKNSFDKMYFSWQTGFVKPDIRAYEKVLSDLNLLPEECLYFDDSPKNIQAAGSLNIHSFIYKNRQDVLDKFNAMY